MGVTIKNIAERTGLSVSTVSLVLNHKDHRIPMETRQRVLDVARELNYRPNQLAVGLVTKRTKTIGLIIPDVTNMFFGEIAKGAEAQCQECGYSIILCNTNDNPQKDIDYVNILVDRGIDGVVFAMGVNSATNCAAECLKILEQAKKPVVLIDRAVPDADLVSVLCDNESGGYQVCRHLLELGHRHIGYITGPMGAQSSKQRFFGYIRALQEFQVPFDPGLVEEGDYHTISGYHLSQHLLEKKVTAIIAANDMMALGVYKRAAENGLNLPGDLSVIGFDNLPFTPFMEVPLTSVNQPACEMGEVSIQRIIDLIEGKEANERKTMFSPELIIRKSTAAVG